MQSKKSVNMFQKPHSMPNNEPLNKVSMSLGEGVGISIESNEPLSKVVKTTVDIAKRFKKRESDAAEIIL